MFSTPYWVERFEHSIITFIVDVFSTWVIRVGLLVRC